MDPQADLPWLTEAQSRHRRRVLTAAGLVLSTFPPAAFLLGGGILTVRLVVPLILAFAVAGTAVVLAQRDRIGAGLVCLAILVVVTAFDAHAFQRVSLTAPVFLVPVAALGVALLPRRPALVLTAALVVAIAAMRAVRVLAGGDVEHWLPGTLDPITVLVAVAAIGFVSRSRMETDQALLERMVSDLRAAQARAEESARAAQEASETRSIFLSRASHELRTPLNAILGYAELLLEEDGLDHAVRSDVARIETAAQHQLRLVEDLLTLTRGQVGSVLVNRAPIPLPALLAPVLARYDDPLVLRGNVLVSHVDPAVVSVDAHHVQQILDCLLSNAVRYTDAGVLTVRATLHEQELQIEVADTGSGIASDRINQLFQPFTQGEACSADRRQGTGLGLAIVAALVVAMGGRTDVHSAVGVGTRFIVKLPL